MTSRIQEVRASTLHEYESSPDEENGYMEGEEKVMRKQIIIFPVMAVLTVATLISGCAALGTGPQVKARVIARTGETIRFFQGGTKQAKEEFCVNETVPVYRYYGRYLQSKEVGKVKITQPPGDHYFDAVVVEGEVKDDDVAMKTSAACLVRIPGPEEKQ